MILETKHLRKDFAGAQEVVRAVEDVSLTLDAGQVGLVTGKSGSGKTTMLMMVGGLLRPTSGEVRVAGQDLYAMRADGRATARGELIGFVFQQFHLIPYLTVRENVMAPTLAVKVEGTKERAREAIALLGMEQRQGHLPEALSTGERQRTAIARAMLARPKLLLVDEPTGNLDSENAGIVLEALRKFAADGGAVMLVSHDERARQVATVCWKMEAGKIFQE